jgi:hypothetical protein
MTDNDTTSEVTEVEGDVYLATHDWRGGGSLSHCVTEVVSAATGTDVERMRPLFETIDPEAVTRLFESADGGSDRSVSASVQFRYEGCRVNLVSDGRLSAVPVE